jgi:hypothetical protein
VIEEVVVATRAQLEAEPEWGREIVTPELRWLGDQLCAAYNRPRTAAGDRGNIAHLYGAHRSQEWIRNSVWCQNRSYTVQPGLTAMQARHIAGFDLTPGVWGTADNRAKVAALTRRYVAAGKAGRLPGVFEAIGTLDGKTPVGIDLPEGTTWPADWTHVDHSHLTLDRRRVGDRAVMERVLAVALGEEDDDMATSKDEWLTLLGYDDAVKTPDNWPSDNAALSVAGALQELLARAVISDRGVAAAEKAHVAAAQMAASHLTVLKQVADALTALTRLIDGGGGNPDIAPIVARLEALTAAVSGAQAGQATLIAAVEKLRAELVDVRGRLAAAYGVG